MEATTADNVYGLGADTFVVRDGKIAAQSFAARVGPRQRVDASGAAFRPADGAN